MIIIKLALMIVVGAAALVAIAAKDRRGITWHYTAAATLWVLYQVIAFWGCR